MQRKTQGISLRDKIENERLRTLSSTMDVGERTMKTKWKWRGHVLSKQMGASTMWDPYSDSGDRNSDGGRQAVVKGRRTSVTNT